MSMYASMYDKRKAARILNPQRILIASHTQEIIQGQTSAVSMPVIDIVVDVVKESVASDTLIYEVRHQFFVHLQGTS